MRCITPCKSPPLAMAVWMSDWIEFASVLAPLVRRAFSTDAACNIKNFNLRTFLVAPTAFSFNSVSFSSWALLFINCSLSFSISLLCFSATLFDSAVSFFETLFTIFLALVANFKVPWDSAKLPDAGDTHVIISVLAFPPSAAASNLVNLLSL